MNPKNTIRYSYRIWKAKNCYHGTQEQIRGFNNNEEAKVKRQNKENVKCNR